MWMSSCGLTMLFYHLVIDKLGQFNQLIKKSFFITTHTHDTKGQQKTICTPHYQK